jgi:hypothetical protein
VSHRAAKQIRQDAHKLDRFKGLAEIFRENREKTEWFNQMMLECTAKMTERQNEIDAKRGRELNEVQ